MIPQCNVYSQAADGVEITSCVIIVPYQQPLTRQGSHRSRLYIG